MKHLNSRMELKLILSTVMIVLTTSFIPEIWHGPAWLTVNLVWLWEF